MAIDVSWCWWLPNSTDGWGPDDRLFRSLLTLPQAPAVLRVSVIALAFDDMIRGVASSLVMCVLLSRWPGADRKADDTPHQRSQFFDVPVISIRNSLLHTLIDDPEQLEPWFSKDPEGRGDYVRSKLTSLCAAE